jgi:hypothetical protein
MSREPTERVLSPTRWAYFRHQTSWGFCKPVAIDFYNCDP